MQDQDGFFFSTDDFATRDRIAVWREVFGQAIARLDMEPPADRPFRGRVSIRELPGVRIGSISSTANRITRTPRLIADGSDDIMLGIMLEGQARVTQEGSEVLLSAGEAVVWSNATVGHSDYPADIQFISVSIPRSVLVPGLVHPDRTKLSIVPASSPTLRLLTGYLQLLLRETIPQDARTLVGAHVQDLVALALGPNRDTREEANRRGLRAARLRAVKADIEKHLGHRDLNADAVAFRHGISPRSLRDLFASEHTTFTEYVLHRRLLRVHRRLVDARYADRTISALAFESGFGDLSYFNHCFRRRFGATPSDIRAASQIR